MLKNYWNWQVITITEKFKYWKIFSFEKQLKNGYIFWHIGTPVPKIGTSFGTLARQFQKLARLWHVWHVYWHIGTLARKNEMLVLFWHVGTLASRHVDHASPHGTRFSDFSIKKESLIISKMKLLKGRFGHFSWRQKIEIFFPYKSWYTSVQFGLQVEF